MRWRRAGPDGALGAALRPARPPDHRRLIDERRSRARVRRIDIWRHDESLCRLRMACRSAGVDPRLRIERRDRPGRGLQDAGRHRRHCSRYGFRVYPVRKLQHRAGRARWPAAGWLAAVPAKAGPGVRGPSGRRPSCPDAAPIRWHDRWLLASCGSARDHDDAELPYRRQGGVERRPARAVSSDRAGSTPLSGARSRCGAWRLRWRAQRPSPATGGTAVVPETGRGSKPQLERRCAGEASQSDDRVGGHQSQDRAVSRRLKPPDERREEHLASAGQRFQKCVRGGRTCVFQWLDASPWAHQEPG